MATYSTEALVLAKTKLGESDLILTLLSKDGSQIRAVAKGVRKPKSKLGGTLELFSVASLLLAQGRNLDIITEATSVRTHEACRADLEHSALASVVCEFLKKLSLEGQEQRHLFDMSVTALDAIGRADACRAIFLTSAYLIKALSLLGYRPELSHCLICGEDIESFPDKSAYFSWGQGGIVCEQCSPIVADALTVDHHLITWLKTLISLTFEDLMVYPHGDEVAWDLLRFDERWLIDNTGVKLKSLTFVFAQS